MTFEERVEERIRKIRAEGKKCNSSARLWYTILEYVLQETGVEPFVQCYGGRSIMSLNRSGDNSLMWKYEQRHIIITAKRHGKEVGEICIYSRGRDNRDRERLFGFVKFVWLEHQDTNGNVVDVKSSSVQLQGIQERHIGNGGPLSS